MSLHIIKRGGRRELFSSTKLLNFLTWVCEGTPCSPHHLRGEVTGTLPTIGEVDVDWMLDQVIRTTQQNISRITPQWVYPAGRVYMVRAIKQHREAGIDFIKPSLQVVQSECITNMHHRYISANSNLLELIDINWDYSLPINDVRMIMEKYGRKLSNDLLEIPSLVLLRQAIDNTGTWAETEHVYGLLKKRAFTNATPSQLHAGKRYRATGSCTLLTVADSTEAITQVAKELASHSKFGSGNGIDMSAVAGKGRYIASTEGDSNGIVPFIRLYDDVLKAWNQGGKRRGSGIITLRWWHSDIMEFLYLKNTKGLSEQRIRGLKYAFATNKLLYTLCDADEDMVLLCPKDVDEWCGDELLYSHGDRFEFWYMQAITAVKEGSLRGTIIKARTVMAAYLENEYNHGNLYETKLDNVNKANMLYHDVWASNLCQEVLTRSSRREGKKPITSLCFLNSTNALYYWQASPEDRTALVKAQVRSIDNQISTDFYSVPATTADITKSARYIGIGLSNLALLFATLGIKWESQEALELMAEFMDNWSYDVITASCDLAEERGAASANMSSKYSSGIVPYDFASCEAKALVTYKPNPVKWNALRSRLMEYGTRNNLMMAIAPTASSGAAAGLTEGIDPVQDLIFTRDGTINVTHAVSTDHRVLNNLESIFDVSNTRLIELAAVRQMWLDQSQSFTRTVKGGRQVNMSEAYAEHKLADDLGVKTTYYMNFQRGDSNQECESCS